LRRQVVLDDGEERRQQALEALAPAEERRHARRHRLARRARQAQERDDARRLHGECAVERRDDEAHERLEKLEPACGPTFDPAAAVELGGEPVRRPGRDGVRRAARRRQAQLLEERRRRALDAAAQA